MTDRQERIMPPKPHTRRACAMPDLPHGRAFFQHLLRALLWQCLGRPLHPVAPALPRSGMAQARLCCASFAEESRK